MYEKESFDDLRNIMLEMTEKMQKKNKELMEREECYRNLVENISDVIYSIAKDGTFISLSPAFEKITGWSCSEWIGKSFSGLIYPQDLTIAIENFKQALQGDNPASFELRIISKSGGYLVGEFTLGSQIQNGNVEVFGIARDITERKKMEEKLKNASREWRITFDSTSDLIMLVDSEMKIIKANLATARFVHKPIKEIIGKTCYQLFHGEDKPPAVCPFVRMKKTKKYEYAELYLSEKDIWIRDSVDPIFDDEGNLTGSVHIIRDITESKRTEEELKWRLEFEKTVTTISSRFLNMFDIDEAINDALRDMGILNGASRAYLFLFNEDGTSMNNTYEWCAEGVTPQIDSLQNLPTDMFPWWMRKLRNGEVIHITDVSKLTEEASKEKKILERQDIKSLLVIPLVSEDKLTGFIGFDNVIGTGEWKDEDLALLRISSELIGSIFRHKKAEEKLYAYQEQLRYLASQLSLIEEQERRRIATDLHDHIGQTLALCKIKLGTLRESISSNLTQSLDEVRNLLEQTIQYTRSLTFELSSPILYELGFEAAVEWLGEQILKRHSIVFHFEDEGQPKMIEEEIRIILFQVVRELLVNVVKHAQAYNTKVFIRKNGDFIRIIVEDDGIGFDVSRVSSYSKRNGGFGFFSIRERLNYIGGYISIESKPGSGTRVTIIAPLKLNIETETSEVA